MSDRNSKKRVSMTLDEEIVEKLEHYDNRSEKVEQILRVYFNQGSNLQKAVSHIEWMQTRLEELKEQMTDFDQDHEAVNEIS